MSIPVAQVIPSSTFSHVGLMVSFMSLMAILCACSFIGVFDMTKQWMRDVDNTLTIEIPAYNTMEQSVLSQRAIKQNAIKIENFLEYDPLVTDIQIKTFTDGESDNDISIPEPVFMTVTLIEDRADQAEERLIRNITDLVPDVVTQTAKDWERDIHNIALSLQTLFGGLLLASFLITIFTISTIIKIQVKAHAQNIELIHLMGAPVGLIAALFKKSITIPVLVGCGIALCLACLSLYVLLALTGLHQNLYLCFMIAIGIVVIFITITRLTTEWTVRKALWNLP